MRKCQIKGDDICRLLRSFAFSSHGEQSQWIYTSYCKYRSNRTFYHLNTHVNPLSLRTVLNRTIPSLFYRLSHSKPIFPHNNPKQQPYLPSPFPSILKKQKPSKPHPFSPFFQACQPSSVVQIRNDITVVQFLIHYLMLPSKQNSLSLLFRQLAPKLTQTFTQAIFTEALMVRHAESQFNKYVHLPKSFLEESFRTNLHHNIRLIDCSLSKEGHLQAQRAHLPSAYIRQSREVDILFVSPLTRALETAELLIKANRLVVKHVIVLPELTEVLSKICDLSSPIEEKRRRFKQFDFSQMHRFLKQNDYRNEEEWQDGQVDPNYQPDILNREKYGLRYLGILKKIFPVPLESSERCFQRSLKALEMMKLHTSRLQAKRVLVVSHNRVLKYLDGRFAKDKATSFQNCQMRKLTF